MPLTEYFRFIYLSEINWYIECDSIQVSKYIDYPRKKIIILENDSLIMKLFGDLSWAAKIELRGPLNRFPGFFHRATFIDSTHMKL